ncbi:hypothetical protein ACOJR9_00260 [Alteromonas sp. A081]|uniref:hypothetical protein n=1 Tax=Alteromonas sp. A081 TaxID=3410269 RepID=UPI003B97F493
MKSTQFGLGYKQNKSVIKRRLVILILLTTLASLVAIFLGMALIVAKKHRRFQANTCAERVLSFHYLGMRAFVCRVKFTIRHWKTALQWYITMAESAAHGAIKNGIRGDPSGSELHIADVYSI